MILRICICIPTYNNQGTIAKVVADCLEQTQFPILVVDDGSDVPVERLLPADPSRRMQIIRHEENKGKGVALQAAIQHCVGRGFTHMLSIDGDGQHLTKEIPKLIAEALKHPWDLIIGNRNMGHEAGAVPGISKFGKQFSNFWVKYQTDQKILDSQSGFRLYPLFHVQNMKFWTKKFDFEIEVLIKLLWRGVGTRDVPIEVYYPPANERVSHFNKFRDNVRITFLNIILIIISLLRDPKKPSVTALAVGVGTFIGCTPLFGFHTLIVGAVAFFFKLNAVYLWLGSHISIPPVAPFLAAASINIGQLMTGNQDLGLKDIPLHWMLGSLVLGTILGTVTGLVTYLVQTRLKKSKAKNNWNGKSRGGRLGNWFLAFLLKNFGFKPVIFCFYFMIPYFYLFAPKARRAANEYWKTLRPEVKFLPRQWLVLKHLFTFAKTLLDRLAQSLNAHPNLTGRSNGWENITEAVKTGRGLILLSAHIGSWDLAVGRLKGKGYCADFQMVRFDAEPSENAHHISANLEEQPIYKIRQALMDGKPVGFMGDRPLSYHFELVPFHGKLAPFDLAPFRIAAACRSQMIFTYGFNNSGNCDFFATAVKNYEYSSEVDKNIQCYEWLTDYVRTLEFFTKRYSYQWFNFYPFWSSVPVPPIGNTHSPVRASLLEELQRPVLPRPVPAHPPVSNASQSLQE